MYTAHTHTHTHTHTLLSTQLCNSTHKNNPCGIKQGREECCVEIQLRANKTSKVSATFLTWQSPAYQPANSQLHLSGGGHNAVATVHPSQVMGTADFSLCWSDARQWCTYPSVSNHRRIKSQKTDCSNPPQDLSLIKTQFWWSRVPLFCGAADKRAIISPQNSSLGSALKKTDVLTSTSGPQRHHVLAEVSSHVQHAVKVHYVLCFLL